MKNIRLSSVFGTIFKRSITPLLAFAILCLGLLNASTDARADDSLGSVSQVTGSVQIQRDGATLPAQPGTPVKLHDTVTTQPGSNATLMFADGSSLSLTSGTSLTLEDAVVLSGQTLPSRVKLLSGNVHANVPDNLANSHRIEIDAKSLKSIGPAPN